MEWDAVLRAWFCSACGRLYRLARVAGGTGYAVADRWQVGSEDGDDA
jgi:hypothetical protein